MVTTEGAGASRPSPVEKWVAQCDALGMATAVDGRDLVHVLIDGTDIMNCHVPGDGCGWTASGPVTPTTRLCFHCRELPGRERHYRKVVGESY